MKKRMAILLLAVLLCSLTACAKRKGTSETTLNGFPTITYLYNTSENHRLIGEYIQSALKNFGIPVKLENQEWNTFLNTRKSGDYSLARNGWVADYNDPICFLDLWTSTSGNNDIGFGKGEHAALKLYSLDLAPFGYDVRVTDGTWSETYDVLISKIKGESDTETRYEMMHLAEDMLMETGCIIPLYFYTDLYMLSDTVEGFYANPLGIKYFTETTVKGKSVLDVSLASEPESLDPALNSTVDGGTMLSHLFSGLLRWSKEDDGRVVLHPDCAVELPDGVPNADGSVTYTYTLREGLKWSNGEPLTAKDFVYAWNRAASPALAGGYGYMFEVIRGYKEVASGVQGAQLDVRATDDRTLVVTLESDVSYWNELLAFPTFFPVYEEAAKTEGWATSPKTYVSNGPYKMTAWEHNSFITLSKNEDYHDRERVTMPTIACHLSDDANNMLANFKNGSWLLIDNVPTSEIATLKREYPNEFVVAGQIGTYYVAFNINERILPKDSPLTGEAAGRAEAEIRRAIALLFDRAYIVSEIAQGGEVPASSFVAMGITNPDGSEFYKTAHSLSDDFDGYFDVREESFEAGVRSALAVLERYYGSS